MRCSMHKGHTNKNRLEVDEEMRPRIEAGADRLSLGEADGEGKGIGQNGYTGNQEGEK